MKERDFGLFVFGSFLVFYVFFDKLLKVKQVSADESVVDIYNPGRF